MRIFRHWLPLLFPLILWTLNCRSQVRLPRLLSDHLVLQQQAPVTLWGWAAPGEKVFITPSWDNHTDSVITSRDAKWSLALKTPAAGGPYTITFKASNILRVEDVMLGEVWLLSGQSNMEWSALNNNRQAMEEAPLAQNTRIRLFHVPKTTAIHPQEDYSVQWSVCNPEAMRRFSAVGYFFGKKLQEELNVPIGLINASWGGTAAEVWTPREVVESDLQLTEAAATLNATPWWPNTPGSAYNAMIAPALPFRIAGALWYQGESNTSQAQLYTRLFTKMIGSWRTAWQHEFPFYYVQIAPFAYGRPLDGAYLREAQSRSSFLPKTGMVVISDLVDDVKDIHPQNKKEVAERLARLAMAETYQKNTGAYRSPSFERMVIEDSKIRIYFNDAPNGLQSRNGPPSSFLIAGEDRIFYAASARIEGNTVVVSAPEVRLPVAVRFGFSNESMPNLFSKEGLPVDLFRTDTWR